MNDWMKCGSVWMLAAVVTLTLGACGPEKAEHQDGEVPGSTATEEGGIATDVNPIEAQLWLDDFTLGTGVDATGAIPAEMQADEFAPGATIYLSMEVGDAPANAAVKVAFFSEASGEAVGEDEKKVPLGAHRLYFTSADTSGWSAGEYRAEVWVGDEKVNDQHFAIGDAD